MSRMGLAAFAVALFTAAADAQVAPGVSLAGGGHVRVTALGERTAGVLVAHDVDSIRIRRGSTALAWSFADIQRLEVRGGRDRRRGFMRGALILGGVGVVFGGIDLARGGISGGSYVETVVTNALIGGALGVLWSPRGWREVPLLRRK